MAASVTTRKSYMLGTTPPTFSQNIVLAPKTRKQILNKQINSFPEIDWTNQISRGLVIAGNYNTPKYDLVANKIVTNTRIQTIGPAGNSVGGIGGLITYPNSALITSATGSAQPRTIFFLLDTTTSGNTVIAEKGSNSNFVCQTLNNKFSWRVAGDATGKCDTTSNITSGFPVAVCGTFDGNVTQRVYFQGKYEASATPSTTDATNTDDFVVGARAGDLFAFPGRIYCMFVWNRQLTDAEIYSISLNPWQLFKNAMIKQAWVPV